MQHWAAVTLGIEGGAAKGQRLIQGRLFNAANEEFGDARFVNAVQRLAHMPPAQLLPALVAAVDEFAQGVEQADDIGCLIIERKLGVA